MTAHRGLFTRPDSARGTSPVEARKSLSGLFQRLASGAPRPGLLTPLTVAGTTGWAYSVPAGQWVTSRGAADGVVLAGNDGTVQVATNPAPATGSRIDVIYVLSRDVDNGDANSDSIIGVAVGAASGTPTAPSIPAGAMEIARATVLATNANTNVATITQTAPYTGLAGADLVVPFGLASFAARIPSPVDGMGVYSTTEAKQYSRLAGAWKEGGGGGSDTGRVELSGDLASGVSGTVTGRRIGDLVSLSAVLSGSFPQNTSGLQTLGTLRSAFRPQDDYATTAGVLFVSGGGGFSTGGVRVAMSGALQLAYRDSATRTALSFGLTYVAAPQ